MRKSKNPECPQCGSTRTYKTTDDPSNHEWRCKQCDAYFEPDDEGGDYSTKDPSWRMQREEARQQRERERMIGRGRG